MPSRERGERSNLPIPVRLVLIERELDELRRELDELGGTVESLSVENRIRSGVRKELAAQRPQVATATADRVAQTGAPIILTTAQKIGGAIAALILILDAVRGFLG